ncbi:hypothetical protein B0F90DRAFT_1769978 [Multifurca ochricompacta]|uniref:Uncharacterized protein n=1 Tax=Multifurca ochricompacta TaxID=376703 RepID=A0AAD4QIG5_9AGAM|nr:hypothetical protein B0F90DRAFT_1769978 [Multifurca ochricompacta]
MLPLYVYNSIILLSFALPLCTNTEQHRNGDDHPANLNFAYEHLLSHLTTQFHILHKNNNDSMNHILRMID